MADDLQSRAQAKYGFLKNLNLHVKVNPRSDTDRYAETWAPGNGGNEQFKRPAEIPMDSNGVEIYKPDQFTEDDLAGEGLHIDKIARETSDKIRASMTPKQARNVAGQSGDFQESIESGMTEQDALRNAVDSMVRGYVVGQWPREALEEVGLQKDQLELLDKLRDYAISGKSEADQEQQGFQRVFPK